MLVFQIDGTVGFYFYNGSGWDTLGGASTVVNISNVVNIENSGIAVIRDEKASGVDGGTFTTGAWRQRDLDSLTGDTSFISLGTNDFSLDSGVYVITAAAPAFSVAEHQIRLWNSTSSIEEAVGSMEFNKTNATASSSSTITTVVSVGSAGATFEIQHRCASTRSTNGFGLGASWGVNVYTQVKVQKL